MRVNGEKRATREAVPLIMDKVQSTIADDLSIHGAAVSGSQEHGESVLVENA